MFRGFLASAGGNEGLREWIEFTYDHFEPYIRAGRFQGFDEDIELTAGIRALGTHGHTPGHTSYRVESKGQVLMVLGDLVLMGAMQFSQPSLVSRFDTDRQAAVVQRQRILKMVADGNYWVAGAHLSFPGIGRVRSGQEGYVLRPIEYAIPH